MKTFKLLSTLAACMILALGFISCSDKDNEPKSNRELDGGNKPTGDELVESLQGDWVFEKAKAKVMGQIVEMGFDEIRDYGGSSNPNDYFDYRLSFNGMKVNGYTYSVRGNKVLLPWYEDLDWWTDVSFSGSSLTFHLNTDIEGIAMETWFIYVRTDSRTVSDQPVSGSMTIFHDCIKSIRQQ